MSWVWMKNSLHEFDEILKAREDQITYLQAEGTKQVEIRRRLERRVCDLEAEIAAFREVLTIVHNHLIQRGDRA